MYAHPVIASSQETGNVEQTFAMSVAGDAT